MPLHLTWQDVALRLALTLVAGALVGLNRGERGHAAGLRTTTLVCLAASISMLQVNAFLPLAGKDPTSFVSLDLLRLPLGILSGMGFIGAGAILRRGGSVAGLTTAATLWLMTMVGLCFGAGQLALGGAATGLALVVLWAMGPLERRLPRIRHATLVVVSKSGEGLEGLVRSALAAGHMRGRYLSGDYDAEGRTEVRYAINWRTTDRSTEPTDVIARLWAQRQVTSVRWCLEEGNGSSA